MHISVVLHLRPFKSLHVMFCVTIIIKHYTAHRRTLMDILYSVLVPPVLLFMLVSSGVILMLFILLCCHTFWITVVVSSRKRESTLKCV